MSKINRSITLERLFDAQGQRTGLYRAEFEDETGLFLTGELPLKQAEGDINHYISSLGYNYKYKFYAGRQWLTTKEIYASSMKGL